MITVKGLKSHR